MEAEKPIKLGSLKWGTLPRDYPGVLPGIELQSSIGADGRLTLRARFTAYAVETVAERELAGMSEGRLADLLSVMARAAAENLTAFVREQMGKVR